MSPKPYVVWGHNVIIKDMYYVYILKSIKDNQLYIGYTTNLRKRYEYHQKGLVKSTSPRRPFKLIFYEAFRDKADAKRREKYFKTNKGKSSLNQIIRFSATCPQA